MPMVSARLPFLMTVAAAALLIMGQRIAWADPSAHFELRLAPGQTDADLILGDSTDDTLNIEVWGEVTDAPPGTVARWYGFFPRNSQTGVINYNGDYMSSAFTFGCVFAEPDNTPATGDLTTSCVDLAGTAEGVGAPAIWGTFSVQALGLGATSYSFAANAGLAGAWSVVLDTGETELVTLSDSDCSDGSCNLTGSVQPELAVIRVFNEPQVERSPDADGDGDVDAKDYLLMQTCASIGNVLPSEWCKRLDLNFDNHVTGSDLMAFTSSLTGVLPALGDVDADGDIDLADFGVFQICRLRAAEPGFELYCRFADVDRNGAIEDADITTLVDALTGPTP